MKHSVRAFRRLMEQGERLVVAGLGDSLTCGWLVRRSFFERFCDGLEARYPAAALRRVNSGVPGSTALEGLERVNAVLRHRPQLAMVQFGLNDCFGGVSSSEFRKALGMITDRLLEGEAMVILVTSNPPSDAAGRDAVQHFYEVVREVGLSRGVPVAHLDRIWLAHTRRTLGADRVYQIDGVHPTDEGHEILAMGLLSLFGGQLPQPRR